MTAPPFAAETATGASKTGAPTGDGKGTGNADVIPIDGPMIVADNMVLTRDKAAEAKEAGERLKSYDTDSAMETPKQGPSTSRSRAC